MPSLTIHEVVSSISVNALEEDVSKAIHAHSGFITFDLMQEKSMAEWIEHEKAEAELANDSDPVLDEDNYADYVESLRQENQYDLERKRFHLSITNMIAKETGNPRITFSFSIKSADVLDFEVNRFREIPTAVIAKTFANSCASLTDSELKNSHEIKAQLTNFDFARVKDNDCYLGKVKLFLDRISILK